MSRKERKENEVATEHAQSVVSSLQQQVEDLSEEYEDYRSIVQDYDGFIAGQKDIIAEQTTAMQSAEARCNQYRSNLEMAKQQHAILLKQHEEELAPYEARYNALKPAADAAANNLKQRTDLLESAKASKNSAEDSLSRWNRELDDLTRYPPQIHYGNTSRIDYDSYNVKLTRINNGINGAQNDLNRAINHLQNVQYQYEQALAQYNRDYSPFEAAQGRLEEARKKCQAEAEASENTIKSIESDLNDALGDVNTAVRNVEKAKRKIAIAPEIRDDPSRVAAKEGELSAIAGKLEGEKQQLSQLRARGEELQAERKRWWKIVIIIAVVIFVVPQLIRCVMGY